jgi:ribose transport system permease protein
MPDDRELVAGPREQAAAAGTMDMDAEVARSPLSSARIAAASVKELNILIALIVLCVSLSFLSPYFLTTNNALGVARAFTLTAIAAIGQTMVIMTGGIDLSVGSIIGLSGLSTGMLLVGGWPLVPAVLAGLAVGMLFGFCNGLLITRVGLPPFIATLGTLSIGRGLIYVLVKG